MDWVKIKEGVIEKVILGFVTASVFSFTVYIFSSMYKASETLEATNTLVTTQVTEINESFKIFNDMQVAWNTKQEAWNTKQEVLLNKQSAQLDMLLSGQEFQALDHTVGQEQVIQPVQQMDSEILLEQRRVQQNLNTHIKGKF